MNRAEIGAWGEEQARMEYEKSGFRLVQRNYRVRPYEIDLILENGTYLVFCEVKTRKTSRYGQPCEAVTPQKQQRLLAAASYYLSQHPTLLQPRLDVCEILYRMERNGPVAERIHIIENAFGE